MKLYLPLILFVSGTVLVTSCKKEPEPEPAPAAGSTVTTDILTGFSSNVAQATYNDLSLRTSQLHQQVLTFRSSMSESDLAACKQLWRDARMAWEQSESFLFGPVSTDNIDPRIDTWPVNFTSLDSVLNSSAVFTSTYVDSLEDALKGFHPIEYLLFGQNGNKTAMDFNSRQLDYLEALTLNLEALTYALAHSWDPQVTGNYHAQFTAAGNNSSVYASQRAAFEELVNSMTGICDEVANGKMFEPFSQQNAALEESPFAKNSITDFINNIKGVENAYLGKYTADGTGLEDLVRQHNLSLDGSVKTKISTAISSLNAITVPFGQAITQQPVQVQNAMNAINDLKAELENNLLPFVQQHTN